MLSVDVADIHVGWIKAIRPNPPKHPDVKTIEFPHTLNYVERALNPTTQFLLLFVLM